MRIRTQFILTVLLFGIVLAAISASAIVTGREVAKANEQENVAHRIAHEASELSYLASDYLIYQESQQLDRWQTRFASFSGDVSSLDVAAPEQQALVSDIEVGTRSFKDVFDSVAFAVENSSQGPDGAIDTALFQTSWSRLAVQSQGLVSDATRLSELLGDQADRLQRTNTIVVVSLIGVLALYFVVNFLTTQRRALRGIAKLQGGTAVIGSGNLDFRLEEKRKDEIGDLSRAFNRMTANLKSVTASKAELEGEILKRNEAEEELKVSNEHLQEQAIRLEEEAEDRAKAEELLQLERDKLMSILNSMEDAVTIMEPNYTVGYINPSMRDEFGDVAGRKCHQYFNALDDVCSWCNNEEVFAGKTVRKEAQSSITGRTYEITDAPLKNADGSVSKLAVFHDITERKKAEQLKDDFIGMVSHELKTPITVVIGAIYTAMSEGIDEEEARLLLEDAVSSAEFLAGIVDNLLELSRAQANRLMIRKETVDISETAQKAAEKLVKASAIHRLVVDIPRGLPKVRADQVRVERVLHNLMENAIKYSPNGGTIAVFARQEDDRLIVGVKDEGIGISAADQARLFQPFERLGTTAGVAGVGLGLKVCRRLVEAHGGQMWVESTLGKGATFFFSLPLG